MCGYAGRDVTWTVRQSLAPELGKMKPPDQARFSYNKHRSPYPLALIYGASNLNPKNAFKKAKIVP